jgi:transcriptional regulator with XRE-family HTH domain
MLRAIRIRRGLRQVDVARLAAVSSMTVSRIERGLFEVLSLRTIRRVARVLEVRLDLAPWSRHGDLHRFATADHAGLVESVISALVRDGWEARAEVSFSHGGERGFIDILAWHPPTRTLLVVEVKTEIVDLGETLGTLDRKVRLSHRIAGEQGWDPLVIARVLLVADTKTNRRRLAAHAATVRSRLPMDGRRFRGFLRRPALAYAGVAFWTDEHQRIVRPHRAATRRVRRARACSAAPGPRVLRGLPRD